MARTCYVWAAAAAVLEQNGNTPLHYAEITKRVLRSGITKLGRRSESPERTMGSTLLSKLIFQRLGNGFYQLREGVPGRDDSRIAMALLWLKELDGRREGGER